MVRTNVPSSQQNPTSNGSKVNLPFNGKRHSRQSQLVPWFCRKSPSVRDFPDMFDLPLGTELKIMAKSGKNKTFRIKKLIFHVSGPCFFPFQSRPKFTRLKCFSGQEWKSWYPITKTGGIYGMFIISMAQKYANFCRFSLISKYEMGWFKQKQIITGTRRATRSLMLQGMWLQGMWILQLPIENHWISWSTLQKSMSSPWFSIYSLVI